MARPHGLRRVYGHAPGYGRRPRCGHCSGRNAPGSSRHNRPERVQHACHEPRPHLTSRVILFMQAFAYCQSGVLDQSSAQVQLVPATLGRLLRRAAARASALPITTAVERSGGQGKRFLLPKIGRCRLRHHRQSFAQHPLCLHTLHAPLDRTIPDKAYSSSAPSIPTAAGHGQNPTVRQPATRACMLGCRAAGFHLSLNPAR